MRFWLTFLPEQERTLQPTGIHLFGLRYWSAALSADVGIANRRLLVKYDPRDMSRVFVRRPSGNFVEARYADLTLASITLHEALAARRTLLAKGRREVNTRTIVGTAIEQRKLVDAAVKATATVRRGLTASAKTKGDDRGWGSLRGIDSSKPVPFDEDME
ncbi:Mu transposase C-terminal domain-containing protein [Rhizobium binxianense]